MIKDNVIYFGYGDIAVGSTLYGAVTFRAFKPPQEVGESINEEEITWLSEIIKIDVSLFNIKDFQNIEPKSGKIIEINGYILDFTNYNKKSIDVIIKHYNQALRSYYLTLAC